MRKLITSYYPFNVIEPKWISDSVLVYDVADLFVLLASLQDFCSQVSQPFTNTKLRMHFQTVRNLIRDKCSEFNLLVYSVTSQTNYDQMASVEVNRSHNLE